MALFGNSARANQAKDDDSILLIGVDGDEVCELLKVRLEESAQRIVLRSLRSLFSDGGENLAEASKQFRAGGAELLLASASQRLGTELRRYVLFSYQNVMQAAELLGGVDIRLDASEIDAVNTQVEALCREMNTPTAGKLLAGAGGQAVHLNGVQTAAYMKLPDAHGSSFAHIRAVLSAFKRALKHIGVLELKRLAGALLPGIHTNIPRAEILGQLLNVRKYLQFRLETE